VGAAIGVGEGVIAGRGEGGGQAASQVAAGDPGDEAQQGVAQRLAGRALELEALGAEQVADREQADADADDAQHDGVGEGDLGALGGDGELEAGLGVEPEAGGAAAPHAAAPVGARREVLHGDVDDAAAGLPGEDPLEGGAERDGGGAGLEGAEAGGVEVEGGAAQVEVGVADQQRRELGGAAQAEAAAGGESQLVAVEAQADGRAEAELELERAEHRDREFGERLARRERLGSGVGGSAVALGRPFVVHETGLMDLERRVRASGGWIGARGPRTRPARDRAWGPRCR
jgi:hypothetical protein